MKAKILIRAVLVLFMVWSMPGFAQNEPARNNGYTNAIGLRLGSTTGLDFKHKFNPETSAEIIVGAFPYAFGVTALYERNIHTTVSGLDLYAGGGAHLAQRYDRRWNYVYYNGDYYYRDYYSGPGVGIDGIFGLEYKIPRAPLLVSMDVKPFVEFYRYAWFSLDPGLGVKVTF